MTGAASSSEPDTSALPLNLRAQFARELRTLYVALRGESIRRVRPQGGSRGFSFKMFAGNPTSKVAYFVTSTGQLAIWSKRRWTWLSPGPRIVPVGSLDSQQVEELLGLTLTARSKHCRAPIE